MLGSCAVAIPLGQFFRAPQLPLVVVAMSATFLITSFKTVPLALLQRELRFKPLALIDLSQALVVALSMVGCAALGLGTGRSCAAACWAGLVSTGALLTLRHLPFAWPRATSLQRAMKLSADVVIARLCWYASANADFLLAGRMLGKAALGLYTIGWTLASIPVDRVAALVGQVTPAFFSAVQTNPAALRRYVLRISEGLALITFPISFGLALVANDFVPVVLGPKWAGAIVPLQLLAAYAAFRSITPLLPQVLQIGGDSRFEMWRMVAAACVMPVGFYFSAERWGTVGLAMTWMVLDPVLAFPLYRRVFARIGLPLHDYVRALWPAVSGTAVMTVVVLAVGVFAGEWSPGVRLATRVASGAVAYGLACVVLHRNRFAALRELVTTAGRVPEGGA